MKREETDVLIAGAGLSGLSAARALPKDSFIVIESAAEPGGLCRSIRSGGYTFDYTGHLLHLKGDALTEVEGLLEGNLDIIERRARIHAQGVRLDYPFQLYFGALPDKAAVEECRRGLESASAQPDRANFETWCRTVFGEGIHRHFMKPYNEKLYRTPLHRMSADWVGWIPRPTRDEISAALRGEPVNNVGYNAVFRYPKEGGIGALPAALARDIPVRLRTSLVRIDSASRTAVARDEAGAEFEIHYRNLISTVPLPSLLAMIDVVPAVVRHAASALEAVGVLCLNLGVDGSTGDAHWIYFPEAQYPFFRVGFYHNINQRAAPDGKSALYVEISYRSIEDLGADYRERAFQAIVEAGIIDCRERIEHCVELRIDAAYGLHTPERKAALATIRPFVDSLGIVPIGRYGRWAYTSMGEALTEGKAAALRVTEELRL